MGEDRMRGGGCSCAQVRAVDTAEAASSRRANLHGRRTRLVSCVELGTVLDQLLCDAVFLILDGAHQRCPSVGTCLDQELRHALGLVLDGKHQRRLSTLRM